MKLRVIFLNKKYIYLVFCVVAIFLLAINILLTRNDSISTFNPIDESKLKKVDLTGDKKEDILYIKTEQNKYYIEVNTNGINHYLEPNKKIGSIGYFYSYSPLRLSLMDISKDKIPEIVTQAYQKDSSIQHIFKWSDGKFVDLLFNNDNIIGFSDLGHNKVPKTISGSIKNDTIQFSSYILLTDKFENYDFNYSEYFMGRDSVLSFIKYIESLPKDEIERPSEIFAPNINPKNFATIGNLCSQNCTFTFQNAIFKETKWDKTGDPQEINWTLSFKGTSNVNKDISENYALNLLLKPCTNAPTKYALKINSITLN